jgi:hypothetical protein
MTEKHVVEETTLYDSFVGKKQTLNKPNTLPIDIENSEEDEKETDLHWKGMPEFVQEEKSTYKTIYLHFRNKEDFDEFCSNYTKLMDDEQRITFKTKSMWYPHLDRSANTLKRWMEIDD